MKKDSNIEEIEMVVYQCSKCDGTGRQFVNSGASPYLPIGLSRDSRHYHKSWKPCGHCNGRGFILKPKKKE